MIYVLLTEGATLSVREFSSREKANAFMLEFLLKNQFDEDCSINGVFEGKMTFLEESLRHIKL